MHSSIRGSLENILAGNAGREPAEHLMSCGECSGEVTAMQAQRPLFNTLRAPSDAEPVGGFYARVLQRIEERAIKSIWAFSVYSPFGKGLAVASLSVAVLLGSYVLMEESRDGHLATPVVQQSHYDMPVIGNQAQVRDAVLMNFAQAHKGPLP